MAEALYRKYRPRIFSDVVGQDTIERTLKNAISADKVSHAYLFCGPRGTGKTTTARLLAKALLCQEGPTPEPDGTCEDCVEIAEGRHPDVYELDAASRTGVDNVREEIIGRVSFAPVRGRFKIYIIDEVHMLSTAAFNALLKTLEEPPDHVIFVLCTTDPQKVPETILSRCQRFDFRRISVESIVSRLGAVCVAEGVEFEGEALDLIAHRADGGMRNALTSLEQLIAFGEGTVTIEGAERMLGSMDSSTMAEIIAAIGKRDVAAAFRWTADFVESGADLAQFTRDIAQHVRDMYVIAIGADEAIDVSDANRRLINGELRYFGPERLARLLGVLGDLSQELKTSTNPRLSFEVALTRMVRPESDLTLAGLAERIERLERERASTPTTVVAMPAQGDGRSGDGEDDEDIAFPPPLDDFEAEEEAEAATEAALSDPAEAAPRAVAAAAATASVDEAALQRLWQATLSALSSSSAAYGVLFMNTTLASVAEDGALVIEFPAENTFAFKAAQGTDVQTALAAAIRSAAGVDRPYRLVQASSSQPRSTSATSERTSPKPAPDAAPAPTSARPTQFQPTRAPEPTTPQPATTPQPMMTPAVESTQSRPQPSPAPAPQAPERTAPSDDEVPMSVYEAEGFGGGAGQLDEWLVAGFGEGLSFEEVPPDET